VAITVEKFRELFPEFSPPLPPVATDEQIQMYLDIAETFIDESQWCGNYENAIYFLAAHYLFILVSPSSNISSGPVSSKSFGDVSISYSNLTKSTYTIDEIFLSSTKYGQVFLQMMNAFGSLGILVVC